MDQIILEVVRDNVIVVELNRPEAHNALSKAMLLRLAEIYSTASEIGRALVLIGKEPSFCAGVDSHAVRAALHEGWSSDFEELLDAAREVLRAMLSCAVPTVAAVNGIAIGGGTTYALLADARVTSTSAQLKTGHLAIGSPLDGGSSFALASTFSPSLAMRVLMNDSGLTAADLEHMGLADQPVAPEQLRESAINAASRYSQFPPTAVTSARGLIRRAAGNDFESQWMAEVAELQAFVESGRLLTTMDEFWKSKPKRPRATDATAQTARFPKSTAR